MKRTPAEWDDYFIKKGWGPGTKDLLSDLKESMAYRDRWIETWIEIKELLGGIEGP